MSAGSFIIPSPCRQIEGVRSPATCVREASLGMPAWYDKVDEFVRTPMSSVHSGQTGTPKSAVTPRVLDLSTGQRQGPIQCNWRPKFRCLFQRSIEGKCL